MVLQIEQATAEKTRRTKIQQELTLALFRMTSYSSLAFAPEPYLRKRLGLPDAGKSSVSRRMRQALIRLERRGLVERGDKGWNFRLTVNGKKFAGKVEATEKLRIRKPKKWDEKWRVVIFDIPEKYRSSRERFRRILKKAGFLRLQDSVWIHPYDCEELVAFMRKELRLGGSVLYLIVEGLEGESRVRDYFKL